MTERAAAAFQPHQAATRAGPDDDALSLGAMRREQPDGDGLRVAGAGDFGGLIRVAAQPSGARQHPVQDRPRNLRDHR
ncbi:hypothetical protein, partial [Mesorhizobium sp.]|uniref:hypothetical protein n=1 Tax=Mesorhizobium sp. TaxID=1871066 RepID=UPI0025F36E44